MVVNSILLPMAFPSGSVRGDPGTYPGFLRAIADVPPPKYFIDLVNAVYLRVGTALDAPGRPGCPRRLGHVRLVFTIYKFRWEPRER